MLSHHFITIALIIGSYRYHHNAVGNLILVLFDLGDILLSVSTRKISVFSSNFAPRESAH